LHADFRQTVVECDVNDSSFYRNDVTYVCTVAQSGVSELGQASALHDDSIKTLEYLSFERLNRDQMPKKALSCLTKPCLRQCNRYAGNFAAFHARLLQKTGSV
jgi:hypothetical protein